MSDKLIKDIEKAVKTVTKQYYKTNRFTKQERGRTKKQGLVDLMTKLRMMASGNPELAKRHDEFVEEINNFYNEDYKKPEESQKGKGRDGKAYFINLHKSNVKTPHTLDTINVGKDGSFSIEEIYQTPVEKAEPIQPVGGALRGARKEKLITKGEKEEEEEERPSDPSETFEKFDPAQGTIEADIDASGDVTMTPPTRSPDEIKADMEDEEGKEDEDEGMGDDMGDDTADDIGDDIPDANSAKPTAVEPELEADPVPSPISSLNQVMLERGDPKDIRKADFKTKEELIKDIKFYFKKYGNLLVEEKRRYNKMPKTLKNLKDLHKRIVGKLFPDEPKKTIGIILNADEYITQKIKELLITKSLAGITPEEMNINVESKEVPDINQYGSYIVGVNRSGLMASGNAPIYRSLPSNPQKLPSSRQLARQQPTKLRKLPNQRYDQTNAAKKYVRFNILDAPEKQDTTRLNIII